MTAIGVHGGNLTLLERGTLGEFYEEKVLECLAEAERTKDAALRDRWLTLAIHWKRLARHIRG